MIFVDRQPMPYHLAIATGWLVHHETSGMEDDATRRAEEMAFLADPRARIDVDAIADQRVGNAGVGGDAAIRADFHPRADRDQRSDAGAPADGDVGADDRQRPDLGRGVDTRRRIDHRGRVNPRHGRRHRMEQGRDPGPGGVDFGGLDRDGGLGDLRHQVGMHDDRPGLGLLQRREIFAVIEEADILGPGRGQRRDAPEHQPPRRRLTLGRVGHRREAVWPRASEEARIANP